MCVFVELSWLRTAKSLNCQKATNKQNCKPRRMEDIKFNSCREYSKFVCTSNTIKSYMYHDFGAREHVMRYSIYGFQHRPIRLDWIDVWFSLDSLLLSFVNFYFKKSVVFWENCVYISRLVIEHLYYQLHVLNEINKWSEHTLLASKFINSCTNITYQRYT